MKILANPATICRTPKNLSRPFSTAFLSGSLPNTFVIPSRTWVIPHLVNHRARSHIPLKNFKRVLIFSKFSGFDNQSSIPRARNGATNLISPPMSNFMGLNRFFNHPNLDFFSFFASSSPIFSSFFALSPSCFSSASLSCCNPFFLPRISS